MNFILIYFFLYWPGKHSETFETLLNPYGPFKRFAKIFTYCLSVLSVIMVQMLVLILAYFHSLSLWLGLGKKR